MLRQLVPQRLVARRLIGDRLTQVTRRIQGPTGSDAPSAFLRVHCRTAAVAAEANLDELSGVDLWGGRKPHLAVVNPAVGQDPSAVVSLDGEWDFTTFEREGKHETPQRNGIWGKFFSQPWKNARKISVR